MDIKYIVTWHSKTFFVAQSLSRVLLFVTPWTAPHQALLSSTVSWRLLKSMFVEFVMLCHYLTLCCPFLLLPLIFPSITFFSNEFVLCIRWPNIRASTSASVLLMNIQGWFPLGLTDLISLQSKELSSIFSSITIQKHQFFSARSSLWSKFHICTWLLEKPQPIIM